MAKLVLILEIRYVLLASSFVLHKHMRACMDILHRYKLIHKSMNALCIKLIESL